MRVAIFFTIAIAGAFAADIPPFVCTSSSAFVCKFHEIGHNIKHTAIGLGDKLADVGLKILDATISQSTDIILEGSKAVTVTLLDHFNGIGKRELKLVADIQNIVEQGKQLLKSVGQGLKDNLKSVITKIVGVINDANSLNIGGDFVGEVDNAVGQFKGKASDAIALVQQGLKDLVSRVIAKVGDNKRGISDILKGATSALQNAVKGVSDAFAPAVKGIIDQVANLGNAAKDHATNVIANLQKSVEDLGAKLAVHAGTLVDQGKNALQQSVDALNQIKSAVGDIAAGAVDKVKDTIGSVINTGKDAIGTVVDHVNNVVG